MDLNLNKLPWYGQVGLFVALALGGVAVFYYFYVMPTNADIASGSDDTTVQLWHSATATHFSTYTGHSTWVRSLDWSPDGSSIASVSDYKVHVWRPA